MFCLYFFSQIVDQLLHASAVPAVNLLWILTQTVCLILLLEETLYSTRTKIGFKQYNPSKPAKYKILVKSTNSAHYSFTYRAHAYCVKPKHEPFAHYVCGTEAVIKNLIIHLQHFFMIFKVVIPLITRFIQVFLRRSSCFCMTYPASVPCKAIKEEYQ